MDDLFKPTSLLDMDFNIEDQPETPLQNSSTLNTVPTSNVGPVVDQFLQDPAARDVFAVGADRGNDIATEGFGRDLLELNYGQLAAKYGKEVADNRNIIQDSITKNQRQTSAIRTPGQKASDALLAAGSGFTGIVGGLTSLGVAGIGAGTEAATGNDLGIKKAAANVSEITNEATGLIKSFQSDELNTRQEIQSVASELDEIDRQTEFGDEDDFITSLARTGKEFLDAGDRILSDAAVTGDVVTEALGSLGPSAKLAKVASNAAVSATAKITTNAGVQKVAQTLATAAAVGVSEGSGTYQQTVGAVMALSHDDLLETSDIYRDLIKSGLKPEDAQVKLAIDTGNSAFAKQLPVAAAIGLISSKFERTPVAAFDGTSIPDIARQIAGQAVEEGLQGGTGQFNQNVAIQENVDKGTDVFAGVGENTATGIIAGAGLAGALSAPSAAGNTIGAGLEATAFAVESVRDNVGSVAESSAATKVSDNISNIVDKTVPETPKAKKTPTPKAPIKEENTPSEPSKINEAIDTAKTKIQDVGSQISDVVSEPIAKNGKIAFDALKPAANATLSTASTVTKVSGNAALKVGKTVGSGTLKTSKVVGNRLIIPAAKGGIKVGKVILPVVVQSAKLTGKITTPVVKQLGEVSATAALQFALPIAKSLQTIQEKSVTNNFKNANASLNDTFNSIRETYGQEKVVDLPDYMTDLVLVQNSDPVPSEFTDVASSDHSLLLNAVGVLNKISKQTLNYKEMSPDAIVYAATKLHQLKTVADTNKELRADLNEVINNPEIQKLTALAKTVDLNQSDVSSSEVNAKDTGTTILVAKTNPTNVDPKYVRKLLNHSDRKDLSEEDVILLTAAAEIAEAVNNHAGALVEISKEKRVQLSKKLAYKANPSKLPEVLDINDVSRSIQVGGFTDKAGNKLRSVNDFAADIFTASQSENGTFVNEEGITVPVQEISDQFSRFVTHLSNRVNALNTSFDNNNARGKGPKVPFDTLVAGTRFVKNGDTAAFHQSSPESAEFAAKVHNDATVAASVYNTLLDTFPGLSGEKLVVADIRSLSTETQEQAPQDTTVVEEDVVTSEAPAEGVTTSDEQPQNNPEVTPEEAGQEVQVEAAARDLSALPERFQNAFNERDQEIDYKNANDLLSKISEVDGTTEYVKFAKVLLNPIMNGMNKRIQTIKFDRSKKSKDDRTVAEVLKNDDSILDIRNYKNLLFVNKETQTYNEDLLSIATLTVLDWLTGVRASDPGRLKDTLEDLGITYNDLKDNDEAMQNILYGVPPRQAAEALGKQIIRNWNLQGNLDAPMVDSRGAAESLAKEIITVLADTKLIEINDIPTRKDGKLITAQTLNVRPVKELQKKIGVTGQNSLLKLLTPELNKNVSIGQKIETTDQTQSRGDILLSKVEKKALKRMQDTPHYVASGISNLTEQLGFDSISKILGYTNLENFVGNKTLRRSIEGKNLSIERNFEEAFQVIQGIRDYSKDVDNTPVYYPVSIFKVGRHQFNGINPQNNKILRALVTPTYSTLDMTSKDDQDAFWLTVAQASELNKVENESHVKILKTIQGEFNAEYGQAVNLITQWIETGEINGEDLVEAMGSDKTMAQLNAVMAVAELNIATKRNELSEFQTSLSFELDGKTDGPGNMMSNFGQGLLSKRDFQNFNRVGLFLGQKLKTLNDYFSVKNIDLYEVTSLEAERVLYQLMSNGNEDNQKTVRAIASFAAHFGDFKIEEDGSIHMTRNTSKNPMTKIVYGSGVKGVGEGIADDMILEFYKVMSKIPAGQDIEKYIGYPNMARDIELLFNVKLDGNFDPKTFEFSDNALTRFKDISTKSIGNVLADTAKKIIGSPIKNVNDTLVFLTNVQTSFLQKLFDRKLEALIEKQKAEGKIKSKRDLSARDYNQLVKELSVYAPLYSNDIQQLNLGSLSFQVDDVVEFSSTMDDKLRQKSTLQRPDLANVKIIPYLSIGRGDAMAMNRIYSADNAPTDTLPVFDGIDMPISKVKDYANQINQSVLQNWDADVLGDVVNDFESFLRHVGKDVDLLNATFLEVKNKNKNTTVVANSTVDLLDAVKEQQRKNQARKKVFKNIPLSVDHMGGSDTSYSRGPDVETPLNLTEINELIQKELNTKNSETIPPAESYTELNVSTADAMVKALLRETKDTLVNQTVRAIRNKLPADLKVVTGSIDQLNKYRQENFPDDGQVLSGAGALDSANNTIFLAKNSNETLAHELVHAATLDQVEAHYNGESNPAVERLETLMNEFMGLDFSTSSKSVRAAVNATREAVLGFQTQDTAFAKAAALNEFMAWTLTNKDLASVLSTTRTSIIATMAKKVLNLMKRLMGGVPNDMFSNILFNAKLLDRDAQIADNQDVESSPDNSGDGGNNNDNGEVTPPIEKYSNFWIDQLREKVAESKKANTPLTTGTRLRVYDDTAADILKQLDFGGFTLNEYQKLTFRAIHVVLATEMRLDTQSALAMGNMYDYVISNLTPEMFGTVNAEQKYSTVMELLGSSKNEENVSDSLAVLLALSQTSKSFRDALDQLPETESAGIDTSSVNELLSTSTTTLLRKVIGSIDIAGKNANGVLDNLSESLLRQDSDKEYTLLRGLMKSVDKADEFTSGAMSQLAERTAKLDREVRNSDRSRIVKFLAGSTALVTGFLNEDLSDISAQGLKDFTHMGTALDKLVFVQEFVTEVIGTDKINSKTVSLLDRTNHAVSSVRQAYRENLPVILQNQFSTHPDAAQWKSLHKVLGKNDFSLLFDLNKPNASMELLSSEAKLTSKIVKAETAITKNFSQTVAKDIIEKSQQLADYMNGKGAGHQLIRNAYAINKLAGEYNVSMTADIDAYISLLAIQGSSKEDRASVAELYSQDPEAVKGLVVYLKGLNREEDIKVITESARMNGYKGFIPDHPAEGSRLIIEDDAKKDELTKMGFTRLGDYTAESEFSSVSRGYYFSTIKQGGAYSQGVLQSVQDSYRGVDSSSGLSVSGQVSGIITGESANIITAEMNKITTVANAKETLIPVYDDELSVVHYERAINPDLFEDRMQPKSNLALMLGSWAGRQVEEKFAQRYNNELIDQLKNIYDNRFIGTDDLYVDIANSKDPILKDTWRVIPPQTKEYIATVYGDDSFYVRKDMVNLALGYRDPSIIDIWTGKTRLPESVQKTIQTVTGLFLGNKSVRFFSRAEEGVQGVVSSAKDLIVVRSLIVPYMNAQANIMQLTTRGVGSKDIIRGTREKLAEIEKYNDNVTSLIELEARVQLAANDRNKVSILKSQIQTINDENARMTIAPLIASGAYKNISEGITDLDVQLTSGRMGEWVENQVNKLPAGAQTVAKYGLLSKDTALYKGANKAVQYGDFIAKAILYDHYTQRQDMNDTQAIERINEEFVNFSILPGRVRSYLESIGGTWFLSFKIRIMKTALKLMRDNPVRALITASTVGDLGSPVNDNLANVIAQDRLDYSLGWDMLFGSPELNPWLQVTNWSDQ